MTHAPATDPSSHDDAHSIDVRLPASAEFASTLRVLIASLGADLGFTIDEIDDVRLALNELFTSIADQHAGRIDVRFLLGERTLTITVAPTDGTAPLELDELAATILRSVVDEFSTQPTGATFVKRATEATT